MKIWCPPCLASRQPIVSLCLYVAVAVWSTGPVVRDPCRLLPLGGASAATVPLFNVWTIWWNADRAAVGFRDYWQAPIFHPTRNALAFSEPQPATLIVAPLIWCLGERILAYNLYLWGALVLNGVFAELLLRRLGVHRWVAIGGGVATVLLPIVHWQLEVLQLAHLWPCLGCWLALWQCARQPSVPWGGLCGLFCGLMFWTCAHQAVLQTVLLVPLLALLPWRWRSVRLWQAAFVGAVVAGGLILPLALPLRAAVQEQGFERSAEFVEQLSATLGDYTAALGRGPTVGGPRTDRPYWKLSPGWLKYGFAGMGGWWGIGRLRWRRWTMFLTGMGLLAVVFSLGAHLKIGGWEPWWTLATHWPGLGQVRNVFRFAFFLQLAVVLLAAQGVHAGMILCRTGGMQGGRRRLAFSLLALVGLAVVGETLPASIQVASGPALNEALPWLDFVRSHVEPGKAVACLPFATGDGGADYEITARWMYWGTFHGVPLVDGYSGFFPESHFRLRQALSQGRLSGPGLKLLEAAGVELVVIDRGKFQGPRDEESQIGGISVRRVLQNDAGVDVYRIFREPVPAGVKTMRIREN
ncbi:MAG: hypothetical protein JSS02_16980 [Planctomycetes bacterium]|nr:hypothetical protein [Planctomycetota bacterium]